MIWLLLFTDPDGDPSWAAFLTINAWGAFLCAYLAALWMATHR